MLQPLRKPSEAEPARLGRLAKLPVFFDLKSRRAVLVGGSAGAAWKAELLAAAGADVDIYAAVPSSEMEALLARGGADGSLTLHRSAWSADILKDAALAVADLEDEEDARSLCGRRAGCGRAGERGRQAGLLRFPVRLGRQPFAGGDRHLDGRRRADPGPGDPAQDRDAAASLRRLLGRFRETHARTGDAAPAAGHGATCVLGALLRSGIPGPDAGRLRRVPSIRCWSASPRRRAKRSGV